MNYIQITSEADSDIPYLISIHKLPEISRFISINEKNYFHYVTTTENVFYFKVYKYDDLVAALHCELLDNVIYLSILVMPEFQRQGVGTAILSDIQSAVIPIAFTQIKVSIDKSNVPSLRLFMKMGFKKTSEDDELIDLTWSVEA